MTHLTYDPNQIAIVWGRFRIAMSPTHPVSETEFKDVVNEITALLAKRYGGKFNA